VCARPGQLAFFAAILAHAQRHPSVVPQGPAEMPLGTHRQRPGRACPRVSTASFQLSPAAMGICSQNPSHRTRRSSISLQVGRGMGSWLASTTAFELSLGNVKVDAADLQRRFLIANPCTLNGWADEYLQNGFHLRTGLGHALNRGQSGQSGFVDRDDSPFKDRSDQNTPCFRNDNGCPPDSTPPPR